MNNWIDDIAEVIKANSNGRSIVIWGAHKIAEQLKSALFSTYKIKTAFMVDSNIKLADNYYVYEPDILKNNSDKYYVIVSLAYHKEIKDYIENCGYEKNADYYYWSDCIVTNTDDYYEDLHKNKIIGYHRHLKFRFYGYDSIVEISGALHCPEKTNIYIYNSGSLKIGNNCKLTGIFYVRENSSMSFGDNNIISVKESMNVEDNSKIVFGSNNEFYPMGINVIHGSKLMIGNDNTAMAGLRISSSSAEIKIGNDCMLSTDIVFQANDNHTIFDVRSKKSLNTSIGRKVVVKDHVWICRRSFIMYNTVIGMGSIVGAGSFVKNKKILNNCIVAGVPAKIIRRDIAWSREEISENIADCGINNIRFTEE
jgi:Acetyltransferase (isoleucine patch superfamily)